MRKSNIDITGVNLYDSIQRKPQKTEDTFRRYPTNVRNKSLFILFFFHKGYSKYGAPMLLSYPCEDVSMNESFASSSFHSNTQ